MKNIFLATAIVAVLSACQSNKNPEQTNTLPGVHTIVAEEVLQTSQYTYIHAKEGNTEQWLAVSKMEATVGQTYYFEGGLPMTDFVSKELNRTFSDILFLDKISTSPTITKKPNPTTSTPSQLLNDIQNANPENTVPSGPPVDHTVIAKEVLQTTQYTYIHAKEGDNNLWLAVAKMNANVGKTYYFKGGLSMTDFASKELKRTFKEILFVDNISTNPSSTEKRISGSSQDNPIASKGSAIDLEKKEIKLKHAKDDITIAKLFENKKSYSGKTIKIKGLVTKFTSGIMKKNWIHLQDGTDFSGKFDLTITTDQEVKVGDNITVEGIITLDKDFGFGYFYEVLMDDAKLIK